MKADGARSDLLLNLCREAGAGSTFLGGLGGSKGYLDLAAFAEAGIGVQWQEFKHPTYEQCGEKPFIPGLMALDLAFNCGPRSVEYLHASPVKDDERVAA